MHGHLTGRVTLLASQMALCILIIQLEKICLFLDLVELQNYTIYLRSLLMSHSRASFTLKMILPKADSSLQRV